MPSKVFMICNSYESGFGHGLANDGLDLSKTPHADPEQGEAYQIGYDAGQEARKPKCTCNQGPHAGYCDLYAERPNA
jgi:hypothetical protein